MVHIFKGLKQQCHKNYCKFNSVFVLWFPPSHKNWIGMTNLITFSEIKIHMPDSKVDQKW